MLSQMISVMTLGVFLVVICVHKVCINSFLWWLLLLPGHCRIWLVSSHSCWHSKHLLSCLLLKVCGHFAVGSKLFIYFEICMRCLMLNCLKFSPIGHHAMLSYMSNVHGESCPEAVWDHLMRYVFMLGACLAVQM